MILFKFKQIKTPNRAFYCCTFCHCFDKTGFVISLKTLKFANMVKHFKLKATTLILLIIILGIIIKNQNQ